LGDQQDVSFANILAFWAFENNIPPTALDAFLRLLQMTSSVFPN
jgi:hypothetical protein